ncbi:Quinohemoprotein alcohol dehydrogenase ADH-IIG [Calidithermus terrae]|uniref:Quinohemoprotein alcohol dehydrogenase ADH-IIG n=1 Tax=Calidithermus terrae TaxID=1408545 RepID=A0A399F038_9DEIN|nr:PQQ-binding-like beta-propeller repeat protein [Calidithermus terrae]RIH89393.1 Quinohemoprotein alcohol dehydrogenase ADH-IIG [Calidithermus terrae]
METQGRSYLRVIAVLTMLAMPAALAQTEQELLNPPPTEWPTYGRNLEMQRYSPLSQINTFNVPRLRLTWSRSLGFRTDAQFSPVVYRGIMYVPAPDRVIALNATNGDLAWEYKVKLHEKTASLAASRNRGAVVVFDGKVYHTLGDGRVVALEARTGKEIWSSQIGRIELGEGFTSGPIFAGGKIIVGPSGADIGGVNGRVVALDPQDGKTIWTFNAIPQPGEPGFESWDPPSAAQWGGGSAWNVGAYDPVTRTVIYGIGQPIPWVAKDFRRGDNLYTASWVALEADTGKLKWHYQVIPNDEWDLDQIATPTIGDVRIDGQTRRVALLPTTTGFLLLFDIRTGQMIKWHQMVPELTIHKGFTPEGKPIIDDSFRYQQVGEKKLVCAFRWVDWEPAAFSPQTGLYYRPNTYDCANLRNDPPAADWRPGQNPINAEFEYLTDRFSRYGALSAIDPATGKVVWEFGYGYRNFNGPVVTAGGVVFSGFMDRVFRAFDARTGTILWQQVMPAYMQTDAITYMVEGKQYVAVIAGGAGTFFPHRQTGLPPVVEGEVTAFVFALP